MSDIFCPRQIVFTVPGSPGITITATEHNGAIDFVASVIGGAKAADLRGLFFDLPDNRLAGLTVTGGGGLLTETQIRKDSVIDLGEGTNLQGATKSPFDVGLEWGSAGAGRDFIGTVSFTLQNAAHNLTLDDIASQRFGVRTTSVGQKLIALAPHAPDAHNDSYTIFEDNGTGLTAPTHAVTAFTMNVLANDTDGDGQALTITAIHDQPAHGTVSIATDGKSLLYTPQSDFAGQVTVEYCISDGHGGQDSATATINLTPVADIPLVSYALAGTSAVNEVLITVTAGQTDADSSEYLDLIVSSALPAGVTLQPVTWNPTDEPDQIVHQFKLTLPMDQDANFAITFTATSVETGTGGDTETGSVTVPIVYEHNSVTKSVEFKADDQSIWGSGNSFTFKDDRFIGFDTGTFNESTSFSPFSAGISGHLMAGFQSTLTFNGGSIDALADYDITIETNYNKSVDTLLIETSKFLTGADFVTTGPTGSYTLDFVYDLLLHAYAAINADFGSIDFDPLGIIPGDQTVRLGINERLDFPAVDIGPGNFNLLDLNSSSLAGTIQLPDPLASLSVDFAWPNISTHGSSSTSPVLASGSSNNFLQLNLDIDELITQLARLPVNPLNPSLEIAGGLLYAELDILNIYANVGLNFLQSFKMALGDLVGTLHFEDGTAQNFKIGDSFQIANASLIDLHGDHDGKVEFDFTVAPQSQLTNQTDLGFNVGGGVDILSGKAGYDATFTFFGETIGKADEVNFGPVYEVAFSEPIASVPVYNSSFALNFAANNYTFSA